jgi:hypothetical protein
LSTSSSRDPMAPMAAINPALLVPALAQAADLPLSADRAAIVGALLAAWLPAANELSRKMSAIEHTTLLPITVFTHATLDQEG